MELRILLLITDLQIGGTPTVVRELAVRLLRDETVRVHVACLDRWGPVADQLRESGVAVTALGTGNKRDPGILFRLINLIQRQRFDTVLSFLMHANVLAAGASLLCHQVRFLQSIQTTQPWPRWHWLLQGLAQRRAGAILVPSPSVQAAAVDWAGVAMEKIVVIPNAVEMENFADIRRAKEDVSAKVGGRVGFIGRLDPIKRVGDLVSALPLLGEGVSLHIFGQGAERGAIEAQIDRLGLRGRAVLHGEIARPQQALAEMDVLVLPSSAEGFGLVLIEAMAAGVPVVASNVPGIRDVVVDGVNGILVGVANPAALAEAIGRVLADGALRERLIGGGLKTVQERFTWERVYPMYRAVLGVG